MDELKKYLQQNREALDSDEPSPMVWERIQVQQPVTKTITVISITRWVAAACILVLAGIGTWTILSKSDDENVLKEAVAVKELKKQPVENTTEPAIEAVETIPAPINTLASAGTNKSKPLPPKTKAQRADLLVLQNVENSFKQVINLQRNKVGTIPMYAESAEYFADFKTQMKQLEKEEKSIKAEVVKQGLTDDLLNQLINLYQIKLGTLKQLQTEMNKINNRVKQIRRPVDSIKTYFIHI